MDLIYFQQLMRSESLGYWRRHRIFPLLGRGQEAMVAVCSGSGELHTPLSALERLMEKVPADGTHEFTTLSQGFEGPQSLLACAEQGSLHLLRSDTVGQVASAAVSTESWVGETLFPFRAAHLSSGGYKGTEGM